MSLSDIVWSLAGVVLLIAANGFFVATEFALVSVRRSRVRHLRDEGVRGAAHLDGALEDLDRYIAGTQVGITLASLALGWIGEPALAHLLEPLLPGPMAAHAVAVGLAFAIITFLHVVLGELVPKSLALQRTEAMALWLARPMGWVMVPFRPLVWALNGTGNFILQRLGLHAVAEHASVHSAEELALLVCQSRQAGVLDPTEGRLANRALQFGEIRADAIMVPRPDIVGLDLTRDYESLVAQVAASDHTRLPVFEGDVDHVVGILHVQDLFRERLARPDSRELRGLLRPPLLVPASLRLAELTERLRADRSEVAILLDETGGTAGLLTQADALEELLGHSQLTWEKGHALVPGSMRLERLNELLGWNLAHNLVETLSGYIMQRLGRTAVVGDTVEEPGAVLRVERVRRFRITQVAVVGR